MKLLAIAFVDGDRDAIEALMVPGNVAITEFYGGPVGYRQQLDTLSDLKYESYERHDVDVVLLAPDAAYASHEVAVEGTYRGTPLPPRFYVTEIWVKRDGAWMQELYQSTVIKRR
ncbi:MAG: nuclear transport factor 2 family protein [Hyphomicrobiales bacterium]|nr:nuclear transport factor 2 family protein [Hyphomicrobiales bacterium]